MIRLVRPGDGKDVANPIITRNPTMIAECGCPYDPVFDEDSLGWHLRENHIEEEIDMALRSLDEIRSTLEYMKDSRPGRATYGH